MREGILDASLYFNSKYHNVRSQSTTDKNKIITQSLSYNGQNEIFYINGIENAREEIEGTVELPQNNTVMAIGSNPSGNGSSGSFVDIDVYAIRIYNRGLSKEEIEINNKTDEKRFKNNQTIPIYTAEQLLKAGTGEQVTVEQENKTYTYGIGAQYELKNDITITWDYASIINKINNKEIVIKASDYKIINNGNYYTANSKYTIPVNKYGYVTNGLQLLLDGIDNTGTETHSSTASTWQDLSGNNVNGTLMNMDTSNCWENDGLTFDGIDDYVLLAEMNYDNVTLEAVATRRESSAAMLIVANIDNGGYYIYQNANNRFNCGIYIAEYGAYTYATTTGQNGYGGTLNSKYSITGSYDGKTMKLRTSNDATTYQELAKEGTIGKPANNTYMVLGANPYGTQAAEAFLNGTIYSVRVYNRALTDEEMSANYLNDRERFGV